MKVMEDVMLSEELKVGLMISKECPYLVKFKETFVEEENLYILMEYCSRGDLENRLKKKTPLSDMVCVIVFLMFNVFSIFRMFVVFCLSQGKQSKLCMIQT
jgi:serine/threonine protein kinase